MIITPDIFTPFHTEDISKFSINDEEILKILIRDMNFINEFVPPGVIIWININKADVSLPDSYFWQLCDGAEITADHSPIKTDPSLPDYPRLTPNLLNCYMRMSPDSQRNNVISNSDINTEGSQYHNLSHNHGGRTGYFQGPTWSEDDDNDGDKSLGNHYHSIPSDLSSNQFIDSPAYRYLTPYLKIV